VGTFQRFEDIEAWQKARELMNELYRVSSRIPFARDFRLRDQIRDAGVSIMANIAEGFERDGTGEFIQFLAMAKGSTAEVRSHFYVALDQRYITQQEFDRLTALAAEIGKMIAALMRYLRGSGTKGLKYKVSMLRNGQTRTNSSLKPETRNQKLETP
jgi:four helix bundle protein